MKLEIQLFAGADVPMLVTKEFNYYQDGVTIKSVKVIVTPDTTGIGYDFENNYNCIVEGWQRVGQNGSLYKVYDKNVTETVKFVYTSKVDSSHIDGKVTIVVNEIKKIYERTVWEDAKIIKPAYVDESGVFHEAQLLGGTLINKDRLNNLEEGIENLYENGATSKDIALSELEVTEDTKILFEDSDFERKIAHDYSISENQSTQSIASEVATNMGNIVTATKDGVAIVVAGAEFSANGNGYRRVIIAKNGSGISILNNMTAAITGNVTTVECMALVNCAVGDTFCSRVLQNSGSSLNCTSKIQIIYL